MRRGALAEKPAGRADDPGAAAPPSDRAAADGFASPALAAAFIDALPNQIVALDPPALAAALQRLDRAYNEFPELVIERPPQAAVRLVVEKLRALGHDDRLLRPLSAMVKKTRFDDAGESGEFDRVLSQLPEAGDGDGALGEAALAVRRRLRAPGRRTAGTAARLLATAERLRPVVAPPRPAPRPDVAWPTARLSFDEFLLQWPCEIELPDELPDAAFIAEAYRAILLRGPAASEESECRRLLRDGIVDRAWLVEELLASPELRALERRLRVRLGDRVIVEPGRSADAEMSAVAWPQPRSVD